MTNIYLLFARYNVLDNLKMNILRFMVSEEYGSDNVTCKTSNFGIKYLEN